MRVIFMGTPDFAVPTLESLINSKHEVVAVYTQPDKEKGRGKKVEFSPVKECALKYNIPVLQPLKCRGKEVYDEMRTFEADVMVVVAYGQILKKTVLEMAKYGCINVHASLLPMYRGAAPIQWAVLNGDKETGVTIMQMDEGLDTGDMLKVVKIPIAEKETGESLFDKLSYLGGPALLETLDELEAGTVTRTPQGETTTMYAKMLDKKMGLLDFSKSAVEIDRLIRGLNSWPSAYTYLSGKMLKIWAADIVSTEDTEKMLTANGLNNAVPGTVISVTKKDFSILTGEGAVTVTEIQPEGKKKMDTDAYLRGYPMALGTVLGE